MYADRSRPASPKQLQNRLARGNWPRNAAVILWRVERNVEGVVDGGGQFPGVDGIALSGGGPAGLAIDCAAANAAAAERRTYQEEYRALLDRHGIEYDERYLWD